MPMYDRDYFQDRWRGGGGGRFQGGGGIAGLSVNNWLIIINVTVFVLGALAMQRGLPVLRGTETIRSGGVIESTFLLPGGQPASVEETRRTGTMLVRAVVDPATGEPVGRAVYQVEPVAHALGHFSTYTGFQRLEVWRLLTFQFLHANLVHLLFNMLGLWVFGSIVEQSLGRRKYLAFYLVCGIFGGLMYLVLNLAGVLAASAGIGGIPGLLFNSTTTPLVGASAGVFGVIMACAYLAPNTTVQLLIPPVPLRMRTLAYAYVGIAVASLLLGTRNAGGEAAHVGGAIAGYFFIRRSHLLRDFFDVFSDSRKARRAGGAAAAASGRKERRWRTGGADERAKGGRANQPAPAAWKAGWNGGATPDAAEVDRILDKVREKGLGSLTDQEKDVLRRATNAGRRS